MSVHKRPNGKYEVKWREGGRMRSRAFERKGDADAFDLECKRRKQLGSLAPSVMQSRMTLAEFVEQEWWPRYAVPNLKPSTRRRYLEVWGAHLEPRLGDYELREISPMLVEEAVEQFRAAGLGGETQRKAIMLLSGMLKRAVARGLVPVNPVSVIAKPKAAIVELAQPLAPITVERIRAQLGRFDQIVLDLIAYQGLRPGEATAADWRDIGARIIRVNASKTSKARAVKLLDPVAESLAEWRLACGRPEKGLILPRTSPWLTTRRREVDHAAWTLSDWQNWSGRIYRPAAIAAGVTGDLRAYRLRCSFVSLLLWEGQQLTQVASQAGHSLTTLAKHYAGVLEELEDQPHIAASQAIRQARERVAVGEAHLAVGGARSPGDGQDGTSGQGDRNA
jgi:integrase